MQAVRATETQQTTPNPTSLHSSTAAVRDAPLNSSSATDTAGLLSYAVAVSSALRSHYHVPCVECLGYGSAVRLVQEVQTRGSTASSSLHSAAALAVAATSASSGMSHANSVGTSIPGAMGLSAGGMLHGGRPDSGQHLLQGGSSSSNAPFAACVGAAGEQTRESALCALLSAPELADLGHASCWGNVFQPSMGPLAAFIRREGAAAGEQGWGILPPT